MHILRNMQGVVIGKNTIFDTGANLYIGKQSKIIIGENCYFKADPERHQTALPFKSCVYAEGSSILKIGNNTRIAGYIRAQKRIVIGQNCLVAGGVNIIDANGLPLDCSNRTERGIGDCPEDIIIGDNVWICINSVILKGTIIGNNSVVSAGSVVKGVFPENVLIQGNPAVIVRKLCIKDNGNSYE